MVTRALIGSGMAIAAAAIVVATVSPLSAQRGAAPGAEPGARAASPIDLTGYWVSVVTEDWRFRMVTPAKGDYASVPLNADARKIADAWDPAKDEANGEACKAYGAPNIMRVPGRLHITWQDDSTLKIETDAGTQTRLLRFVESAPPAGDAGWQGQSVARWEFAGPPRPTGPAITAGGVTQGGDAAAAPAAAPAGGGGRGRGAPPPPRSGSLKVVTTHIKPGYLRKNGIPYSENTLVTEYFDRYDITNVDQRFTVTTIIEDPKYLAQPFITSTDFKKEPDGGKWRPAPCAAR